MLPSTCASLFAAASRRWRVKRFGSPTLGLEHRSSNRVTAAAVAVEAEAAATTTAIAAVVAAVAKCFRTGKVGMNRRQHREIQVLRGAKALDWFASAISDHEKFHPAADGNRYGSKLAHFSLKYTE